MSVLGISSQKYFSALHVNSGKENGLVESLQNTKDALQQRLENLKSSDLDAKTKQERVKQLTLQIQQIDQQIVQAKAEEQQRKAQELQEKSAKKAQELNQKTSGEEDAAELVFSPSLTTLLTANSHVQNASTMTHSVHSLEAIIRTGSAEIKLAGAGGSTAYQLDALSGANAQLAQLQPKLAKAVVDIGKDVKHSVKEGETAAKENRRDKTRESQEEQYDPSVIQSNDKPEQASIEEEIHKTVVNQKKETRQRNHSIDRDA